MVVFNLFFYVIKSKLGMKWVFKNQDFQVFSLNIYKSE